MRTNHCSAIMVFLLQRFRLLQVSYKITLNHLHIRISSWLLECSIPHKMVGLISKMGLLDPYIFSTHDHFQLRNQNYFCRYLGKCELPSPKLINSLALRITTCWRNAVFRQLMAGSMLIWGMVEFLAFSSHKIMQTYIPDAPCWNIYHKIYPKNHPDFVGKYTSTIQHHGSHLGYTFKRPRSAHHLKDIPSLRDVSPNDGGFQWLGDGAGRSWQCLIKQPSTLWLFNVAMEKCLILNNRNNRKIIFGRVWTNLMGLGIWDAGFRKD